MENHDPSDKHPEPENSLHNPHDKLLFSTLRNHEMAKDAIRAYFPPKLLSLLSLEHIKPYKTKLVSPQMKEFQADVIYEVPFQQSTAMLLFHCEQESKPHPTIPLKVWQYLFLVLQEYAENHPKQSLPVPFPIVLYTGESKFTYSTQLFDLFGEQKNLAMEYFLQDIPLIDVCRIPDEDIKKHTLFGLTEYIFKHKKQKNFEAILETILPWLNQVELKIGSQYATIYIHYIVDALHQGNFESFEEMVKQYLSKELSETAMTIEQQLIQKGRQEGMQQGMQKGIEKTALKILEEGIDIKIASKLTGLSIEELKNLKKTIH